MKRFYTVKEASEILGFSTNTVYKYLDEGKLKGVRIGQGRFKIPKDELAPYLSTSEKVEQVIEREVVGDKIALTKAVDGLDQAVKGISGDYIFFRLFSGFFMVGVGIIYLIWKTSLEVIFWNSSYFVSLGLILAGLITLYGGITWKRNQKLDFYGQAFSLLVLALASFASVISGHYGSFVLLISLFAVSLTQIFRGISFCHEHASSFREFTYLTSLAYLLMGILLFFRPETFVIKELAALITNNKGAFVLLWLFGIGLPIFYMHTPQGQTSKTDLWIIPIFSVLALGMTFGLIDMGEWSSAYGIYLYCLTGLFLTWWKGTGRDVGDFSFHSLFLIFGWVSTTVVLGLLALYGFQEKLKDSTLERMQTSLSNVSRDIDYQFEQSSSALVTYINNLELKEAVSANDSEKAVLAARVIYDQIPNLTRVSVYDKNGTLLAVYPKNPLLLGKNYSSRDYYRVTKTSFKPYISTDYESGSETQSVIQTQPIFDENEIVGIVGISYNLEHLSSSNQAPATEGNVYAFDATGRYVLNLETDAIGKEVGGEVLDQKDVGTFKNEKVLRVYDGVTTPRWILYLERSSEEVVKRLNNLNLLITLVIIVNSGISIAAGLALSKKWKK